MKRSFVVKQISLNLLICPTILALLLTACAGIGSSKLVVKPEAITRGDDMSTQMAGSGRFIGSVLIAQDEKVLFSRNPARGTDFPTDVWLYDLNTNTWAKVDK